MFITDKKALRAYYADCRLWQGIPGIAVTRGGRIFCTFFSGGIREQLGNYCLVIYSDDGGKSFSEPIVAVNLGEKSRAYDPCLWIDPDERLWFFWACAPRHAVYASVCCNPDAQKLCWSAPRIIGHDVMLNKPIVLRNGNWLLPIAVWDAETCIVVRSEGKDRLPFAYKSDDNGITFERLGGAMAEQRRIDEHMFVEKKDGSIDMYIRVKYGIAKSTSYDGGQTWSKAEDSGLGGPNSRFHISRLRSGRLLLINHHNFTKRDHLTAMLSDDDGKTWKGFLLLDERKCSYPDAQETENGDIYITYDRGRGNNLSNLEEVLEHPREILLAKIREEDILAGKLVSEGSYLKHIINKLTVYRGKDKNPYREIKLYSGNEYIRFLESLKVPQKMIEQMFDDFGYSCLSLSAAQYALVDEAVQTVLNGSKTERMNSLGEIFEILRGASLYDESDTEIKYIIEKIKEYIDGHLYETLSLDAMAEKLNISKYYMCHAFKKQQNCTIGNYHFSKRICEAERLLVNTDDSITDIVHKLGFSSSAYFTKQFKQLLGITPSAYRAQKKK